MTSSLAGGCEGSLLSIWREDKAALDGQGSPELLPSCSVVLAHVLGILCLEEVTAVVCHYGVFAFVRSFFLCALELGIPAWSSSLLGSSRSNMPPSPDRK